MINIKSNNRRSKHDNRRRGAAAVELALVSPIFVALILGIIDIGQYINVSQVTHNASREAARQAAKSTVLTTSSVETAIDNYYANAFPKIPKAYIAAGTTVTITDANGTPIPSGNLATLDYGDKIVVTVSFIYDTARWMSGWPGLNGKTLITTTTIRRL